MHYFVININNKHFRLTLEQYVAALDLLSLLEDKSELEIELSLELERRMNHRG